MAGSSYLSGKAFAVEQFLGILLFIAWMVFNFYKAAQSAKEKKQKAKPQAPAPAAPTEKQPDFRELMEEMRRRAEAKKQAEQEQKQREEANLRQKAADDLRRKQQELARRERQKALEYERFVEAQRREEHDAEVRNLDEKVERTIDISDRSRVKVPVSLRQLILSDVILNRPYK